MCTLTWLASPSGYDLFFNRDEKRSRSRALPPESFEIHGVPCLYATDPVGEGSWLGINAHGVAMAILNHYDAEMVYSKKPSRSRGLLLLDHLDATSAEATLDRVASVDMKAYAPFILATLDGQGSMSTLIWDGQGAHHARVASPGLVTTSSFDSGTVKAGRKHQFQELVQGEPSLSVEKLLSFHQSRQPEPGPYAVSMEREDAMTWSLSHLCVDDKKVGYAYADGPPHETALDEGLTLPRIYKDGE